MSYIIEYVQYIWYFNNCLIFKKTITIKTYYCLVTIYGVIETWTSLVQVMTCHQFGAKSLREPVTIYDQRDPLKYI